MELKELIAILSPSGPNVCIDSRQIKAGDIFVAIKGTEADGHDFIPKAVSNGAKFIVGQKNIRLDGADIIIVPDTTIAAAKLAQAKWANPASKMTNLAVTGTNGKTTVAFLVRAVINNAGFKCGLVGTVVYDTGSGLKESSLTTPDCIELARLQAQMIESGAKYMITEASSHALSQNRLCCIDFKAAAFTNLTGDHLDYHKTENEYLAAKTVLFKNLSTDSTAVLNKQSHASLEIAKNTKAKVIWFAVDEPADLTAKVISMTTDGTIFNIIYNGKTETVNTPLLGRHNISNLLTAAGLCLAAGFDLKTIAQGLMAMKNVPGRLDKVEWDGNFSILVDYAHTDDALKNVLSTLKPLCKGRLVTVFGCGGDRDRTKRPRMAKVAEELSDEIIVTSDNPRTEEPAAVIGEIIMGFENPTADNITVEIDRKKAIEIAVEKARKDDIILIAGKGHEDYQIIGKQKIHFSDKEAALQALKKKK